VADILITGAAGRVSTQLRPYLRRRYGALRLTDIVAVADLAVGESFVEAAFADTAGLDRAFRGVRCLVHLGGHSTEAPWERILRDNVEGAYAVFEAARRAGVERVVFASTGHAQGFHPRARRLGPDAPVRPDGRYGVSKAFGEALASLYADKHGLRCLTIRIGNVNARPRDRRTLSNWVHPEDLAQLVAIGLEHPDIHNQIVYGISENHRSWWDNAAAERLGYRPRHASEDHAAEALAARRRPDPVADTFQGGSICSVEFDGDMERSRWA